MYFPDHAIVRIYRCRKEIWAIFETDKGQVHCVFFAAVKESNLEQKS
jgi:hypothetical protein